MAWEDNCSSCGGHPNDKGELLHRANCMLVGKDKIPIQHTPRETFMDMFIEGTLINLVIMETRVMMRPEDTPDRWDATPILIEKAIKRVCSRFKLLEISRKIRERIVFATMKELEHGI